MDMVQINQLVGELDSFVWGPVMLCLLVGTGVYMTLKLRFLTWRNLPYALKTIFRRSLARRRLEAVTFLLSLR